MELQVEYFDRQERTNTVILEVPDAVWARGEDFARPVIARMLSRRKGGVDKIRKIETTKAVALRKQTLRRREFRSSRTFVEVAAGPPQPKGKR